MITVTFERIGRTKTVPDLQLDLDPKVPDFAFDLAEQVHRYARQYLLSTDYEVVTDGDKVWIGGGRFGKGAIQEVAA